MRTNYFYKIWCLACLFIILLKSEAQIPQGTLITENIKSIAVSSNTTFSEATHPVMVYLPPSYYSNLNKRFPVIYYLGGYSEQIVFEYKNHTSWSGGYHILNSNNDFVTRGVSKEIIMVIAQGLSEIKGAFYTNSEATSNWEDFVVRDLVHYMDSTYRTIPKASSRAIAGLSMGGYGALNLSMKHPDVYSVAYGISSGLFDENGLTDHVFNDTTKIHAFLDLQESLSNMSKENAHDSFMETIQGLSNSDRFPYAYGLAFAPDTSINAPYIQYPYSLKDDQLLVDSTILFKWESGYGNLNQKIIQYKDSLTKLKAYWFDYGLNDAYTWIPRGNAYYSELLTNHGIPHKVFQHTGNHYNHTRESIEYNLMPLCDSLLEFDNQNLNREADLDYLSCIGLIDIDTISIQHNITELSLLVNIFSNISNLSFDFNISPGAKVYPSLSKYNDYTNGPIQFMIVSESQLDTTIYYIRVEEESALSEVAPKIEKRINQSINIYPNPCSNGIVNIEFNPSNINNGTISIYNLSLQKVKTIDQMGNRKMTIDLSDIQGNVAFILYENEFTSICRQVFLK